MYAQARQYGISLAGPAKETILSSIYSIWSKIATITLNVGCNVLLASFIASGVEFSELDLRTNDVGLAKTGHEHAFDQVGKWGEVVHEDPEAGEGAGTCEDAKWVLASD